MNDLRIKIAPYSGWSNEPVARLIFAFGGLLFTGWFFYAAVNSWPKPLDVVLLSLLGIFFTCGCIYLVCSFTKIDEQQITSGCRIWRLGEFFKNSVRWSEVQHAKAWRDPKWRATVWLKVTTKTGKQYAFSAPLGTGADILYSIHNRFNGQVN